MLKQLIENLFNDDEGISVEAYGSLLDYLADLGEYELIARVNNRVMCTNGRYYFPYKIAVGA
jgi:hypothetical protein|tara:strand:+ start:255 stop:440 length:186 start_codon:yes stop_codon:yes gene_type:complete